MTIGATPQLLAVRCWTFCKRCSGLWGLGTQARAGNGRTPRWQVTLHRSHTLLGLCLAVSGNLGKGKTMLCKAPWECKLTGPKQTWHKCLAGEHGGGSGLQGPQSRGPYGCRAGPRPACSGTLGPAHDKVSIQQECRESCPFHRTSPESYGQVWPLIYLGVGLNDGHYSSNGGRGC